MAGAQVAVEFTPASGQMRVIGNSHVGTADARTGSTMSHPMIDAREQADRAWRTALNTAPKPEAARLDSQPLQLSIDVDMTLASQRQDGEAQNKQPFQSLFKGDIHGTNTAH
jgi:hypothetical protein